MASVREVREFCHVTETESISLYRDLWDARAKMMEEFARGVAKVDADDD